MAYSKNAWTDSVTPVDASRMNNIESGLEDQDARISNIENDETLTGFCEYVSTSRINKIGKVKQLRLGTSALIALSANTQQTIATVSKDYAALSAYQQVHQINTSGGMARININTSGEIRITPYIDISVGAVFDLTIVYI